MGLYKQKLNNRTGVFNLVPSYTVVHFKDGVATYINLPIVGNVIGDGRITNDTGHLYIWTKDAPGGLLTDWADQGDIVDLNWSAISGKPSSAVADIDDAVTKRHTQNTDLYLETQVTNTLYVDGNRVDTYTANGTITKPFKKIQDAIDAVTAPSATNKYLIEIAPGAYYSDALVINKVYVTFRSCGVQGARISGAITVTNPSSPTPEQITFVGLRISGGLTCLASHIAINCVDCNVTGSAWTINPTVPTDDEYLQVFGGLYNVTTTLTNVYTYLMGGGYYCTFVATNCEFNINNADINDPFQVTLNGTVIASAYGDRAGNSKFIVNAGATLNIDADTEGGSVLTLDPAAILNRTTKGANIINVPAGTIVATDVQAAINELDSEKTTLAAVKADNEIEKRQIAAIEYYINCDTGSNSNPGTDAEPFQTIQHAIDILPKNLLTIFGIVYIKLQSSLNYDEDLNLFDLKGNYLQIVSSTANANDVLLIGNHIISGCQTLVEFKKVSLKTITDGIILKYTTSNGIINACKFGTDGIVTDTFGVWSEYGSIVGVSSCTNIDVNKVTYGTISSSGGIVFRNNDGFGNSPYFSQGSTSLNLKASEICKQATGNISYFISPTGSDTTGDGTTGNPFATIAKAVSLFPKYLKDGRHLDICLKDGTYNLDSVRIAGFVGGEVWIFSESWDSTKVILNFTCGTNPGGLWIEEVDYLNLQSVSIRINENDKNCLDILGSRVSLWDVLFGDTTNTGTSGIKAEASRVSIGGCGNIDTEKVSVGIKLAYGSTVLQMTGTNIGDATHSFTGDGNLLTDNIKLVATDYDDAITKKHSNSLDHARSHAITSSSDHTSLATSGKMLKADANGLPIDATNTDTDVADAISKKHTQGTDQTLDDGGANEVAVADVKDAVDKKHAASGQFNQAVAAEISGLTDKTTPVDGDVVLAENSAGGTAFSKIKITWSNIKATLKTYFDTLYELAGAIATHAGLTTGVHGVGAGTVAKVADIAADSNLSTAAQDAVTKKHTQNTDTLLTISSSPANVSGSGNIISLTAGENLVFGNVGYIKSDGKIWKADANVVGTYPAMVMALATINADNAGNFLILGIARNDTWTWTVGGVLYLSTTNGGMTQTKPSTTDDAVQVLGVALSATKVLFRPSVDYITVV